MSPEAEEEYKKKTPEGGKMLWVSIFIRRRNFLEKPEGGKKAHLPLGGYFEGVELGLSS